MYPVFGGDILVFTEIGECYTCFPNVQGVCIDKNITKCSLPAQAIKLILSMGQRITKKE